MTNGPSRLRRVPAERPIRTASSHAPTTRRIRERGEKITVVLNALMDICQLTRQIAYFSVENFADSWVRVARTVGDLLLQSTQRESWRIQIFARIFAYTLENE